MKGSERKWGLSKKRFDLCWPFQVTIRRLAARIVAASKDRDTCDLLEHDLVQALECELRLRRLLLQDPLKRSKR